MMAALTGYKLVHLKELLEITGENRVKEILSSFSCPKNPDVEDFLRNKAIEFTKQGIAATHLVFTSYRDEVVLIGYYALANKSVMIKAADLTYRWRRRLSRFATRDDGTKRYYVSLPLIGQLGKNYTNGYNALITGDELLKMACDMIRASQLVFGGKAAYLECEDIPALRTFYEANGFAEFCHRNLEGAEVGISKSPYLLQMLRYFDD